MGNPAGHDAFLQGDDVLCPQTYRCWGIRMVFDSIASADTYITTQASSGSFSVIGRCLHRRRKHVYSKLSGSSTFNRPSEETIFDLLAEQCSQTGEFKHPLGQEK